MVYDARDRTAVPAELPAPAPEGAAFAAWSAAFAVGALIHSWQGVQFNLSIGGVGTLVALAAVVLLLRPGSPARLAVLLAALLAEVVLDLPDLVNHLVVVGVLAITLIPWWSVLAWRSPRHARDPAHLYGRIGPYLRVAFVITFASAALSKLNTGFLDAVGSCAAWILDSIPFVHIPDAAVPAAAVGTILVELGIPTLLLFHRTRPHAVVLGFGFHLVSAFAGHASFSGFAWCFYLLFLPPQMIVNALATARDAVPAPLARLHRRAVAAPVVTCAAFVVGWVACTGAVALLPGGVQWRTHWVSAALLCTAWMGATGWLLLRHRREWLGAPGPRASLRVTTGVMLLGVGLLLFTAAMPYLGLKTRAAFTMFSNVRTEPGQWNHLVLPEAMRVFHWQDGDVRFLGTDDPRLDAAIVGYSVDRRTVLVEARRLVEHYPDATVRYELDGVEHVAAPVSSDPVLGRRLSPLQEWIGAMRPYDDEPRCQH